MLDRILRVFGWRRKATLAERLVAVSIANTTAGWSALR
jgi:hypothetical protein